MKRRLVKLAGLGLVLAIAGFLVAASGIIPIKASSGHWPITKWFLRFSMKRSVATHSLGVNVPRLDDPALVLKGAGHYEFGCRSCHGAPGEPQPRIAQAMLPHPPELVSRIRESNPKRLFHVVKHGLKFTGMPAWPAEQRDDEVWAMVAFLLEYPNLDAAAYRRLVSGESPPTTPIQRLAPTTSTETAEAVNRTCIRCHGSDGLGRGSTVFPKLAGQRQEYMVNALEAYARGTRHSGIMEPIAAGLDTELRRQLSEYYSRLKPEPAPAPSHPRADPTLIELGRRIAHEGVPSRRIPACIECHGPTGRRTKPAYPSLAGQPADYLVLQLELFKNKQRGGSAYAHLMQDIAPRLDSEQMRAAAAYFESLAETSTQPPR